MAHVPFPSSMNAAEITAAYNAVVSLFPLISEWASNNITVIFAIATATAIVGVIAFLFRALFSAVGIRNK